MEKDKDTYDGKISHREWKDENSLTAPSDRDVVKKPYKPYLKTRKLDEKEVESALNELNDIYQKLIDHKNSQESNLNNLKNDLKNEFFIKLYKFPRVLVKAIFI